MKNKLNFSSKKNNKRVISMFYKEDEFEEKYPGMLEKISENLFDNGKNPGIEIMEHYYNDAIESQGYVYFLDKNEKEIGLSFVNGNVAGFEVRDYGEDIELPKRHHTIYTFSLKDEYKDNKKVKKMFLLKEEEFKKKAGEMAYDMHFDPCNKTYQHYKDYMDKWKLQCNTEVVEEEF